MGGWQRTRAAQRRLGWPDEHPTDLRNPMVSASVDGCEILHQLVVYPIL